MKEETTLLQGSISRNQEHFWSEFTGNNGATQQLFTLKDKVYLPCYAENTPPDTHTSTNFNLQIPDNTGHKLSKHG